MTREIKFRFWNGVEKKMYYPDITEQPLLKPIDEGDAWLQYTGLKDKNGKEIYEGEVFGQYNRLLENGVAILGKVVYDNDLGAFVVQKENGGFEYLGKFLLEEQRAEIIGNIYQNPELIAN